MEISGFISNFEAIVANLEKTEQAALLRFHDLTDLSTRLKLEYAK